MNGLLTIADVALALAGLPVLVACGYLLVLTLLSAEEQPPAPDAPRLYFDVVVPAHDEEAGIARTVESLHGLAWPRALFRVLVVADNCSDETAARARAAGATVLERADRERRGKGYALAHAFEHSLAEGRAQALVVIDADTVVSPNLLAAFAARLERGAAAVQADYAVQNASASWRTRLMAIALGMFHVVRSRGRERLGVSCGLRGNGMCFSAKVLRAVPHDAFSVVEDLEYGIRLADAGERVWYAGEAHVFGEMVTGERASRTQRRRWEGGRLAMARAHGGRLLARGLRRRDGLFLDLALDVLVPPLSTVAVLAALGLGLAGALAAARGAAGLSLPLFAACALALAAYVARGWSVSGTGARGLLDLAGAPLYIIWKLTLRLRRASHREGEWVRTAREKAAASSEAPR